tara:strand:- start:80 stop:3721 length:3642 start_codon:yes stop_codon:yes gene_type:complete
MAADINQENILGEIIPDVYITEILLESSGSPLKETNPHVDHPREHAYDKNRYGRNVTNFKGHNYAAKDTSEKNNQLIVTLELSLLESLDDSMISTWFEDQNFSKYLKLKVIQSDDPAVTTVLSSNANAIQLSNTGVNPSDDDEDIALLMQELGIDDATAAYDYYQRHTTAVELSVATDVEGDNSNLTQTLSTTDNDGNSITEFTYRTRFDVSQSEPAHLAYFAVSYIDMVALRDDYNLQIDEENLYAMNGKVVSDVAINDYEIVSTAYVYYDSSGAIWTGAVNQDDNGQWWSGSSKTSTSVRLTLDEVSNDKIQDFRNVEDIERLQIDLTTIENEVFSSKNRMKVLTTHDVNPKKKVSHFSDIMLSRSLDNNARFSFLVDFRELVRDNSMYGKLLNNASPDMRESIMKNSKIKTLKVFRNRVRQLETFNRLGSPYTGQPIFDTESPPQLIAISGEKRGTFKAAKRSSGSVSEVKLAMDDVENRDIRMFTGVDNGMAAITDGFYQYSIEMDVEDGTVVFLKSLRSTLLRCRKYLLQYYNEGSKLGMSRHTVEVSDPHIDHVSEMASEKNHSTGNFDVVSNRFTQNFINQMNKKYTEENMRDAPWIKAITEYLYALSVLTNVMHSSGDKIRMALYTMASPYTGNPKGVAVLMRLIDQLCSKIGRLTEQDSGATTEQGKTGKRACKPSSVKTKSTHARRCFTVEKRFFEESFDSNIEKNTGYDYLSISEEVEPSTKPGLLTLSGAQYKARVGMETARYFTSEDVDITIRTPQSQITDGDRISNTSFTFLSPAIVKLSNPGTLNLLANATSDTGEAHDDSYYTAFEAGILRHNSSDSPNTAPATSSNSSLSDEAQIYKSNMSSVYASLGMTFESIEDREIRPLTDNIKRSREQVPNVSGESEVQSVVAVDPHVKINSTCEVDQAEDANNNPAVLLAGLSKNLVRNGFTSLNPFAKASTQTRIGASMKSDNKTANSSTPVEVGTIDIFNLSTSDSIVDFMSRDKEIITSTLISNGQEPHSTIRDALVSMPNQLKSLMLDGSGTSSAVKRTYFTSGATDAPSSIKGSASFKMNYQMINRIEYLAGLEISESGVHIKSPIWKPLTNEVYKNAMGGGILCRQKPYENPKLGIVKDSGIELPVFNEYFLITPTRRAPKSSRLSATTKYGSKDKIFNMLIQTNRSSNKVGKKYKNTNSVTQIKTTRTGATAPRTGTMTTVGGY